MIMLACAGKTPSLNYIGLKMEFKPRVYFLKKLY